MSGLWNGLIDALAQAIAFLHDLVEPLAGAEAAWGWAIVLLTVAVRLALLPLAVKQTNSMRAMQRLQPEMKKIQAKYKADRDLMRANPEKYRERRQQQQEAMMKLYKEHNVNPAAGCLPLLLQMPVFVALYRVLGNPPQRIQQLSGAAFYLVPGLGIIAREAGFGGWLLIVAVAATTYWSQRQMMTNTPVAGAQAAQQQIMLYLMPLMLASFAYVTPSGVLVYWVTTNLWTIAQQWVMFRKVETEGPAKPAPDARPVPAGTSRRKSSN